MEEEKGFTWNRWCLFWLAVGCWVSGFMMASMKDRIASLEFRVYKLEAQSKTTEK